MNTPNAIGFIVAGLMMQALHFSSGVTAVRELWLLVMGGVLLAVGCGFLAQGAWAKAAPRLQMLSLAMARRRAEATGRASAPAGRRVSI